MSRTRLVGRRRGPALMWIVWTTAGLIVAGVSSCTSGPGTVDARPYDAQIVAFRLDKDRDFKAAADSPIPKADRAAFAGLAYYPIDSRYHVPALLTEDRSGAPVIIEMQTSTTERDRMRRVGTLGFTIGDAQYRLTAFASVNASDMQKLFVPFGDLTNGGDTYKGGRFLDLDRTPTGLYDLDFNRSYQPFCVYNPDYVCPVPPRDNRLPLAIRAGEKLRDVDRH